MRHTVCVNDECVNKGAPYFDFEPAETIVLCPVCQKAMQPTTLAQLEEEHTAREAAEADEHEKSQAELAAAAASAPPATPTPLDKLASLPPDRVVTASELLAILRPEPATEEKPDA